MDRNIAFVVSCEHAGNYFPPEYIKLLDGNTELLSTHEAYDPGALALGKILARRLGAHLFAGRASRLLINLNRSPHNPNRFSRFTRHLPLKERRVIEEKYYMPHRTALQAAVERLISDNKVVVHICVHSFVPELNGKKRTAHIGLLYDPSRIVEGHLCARLKAYLKKKLPKITVRRNYPYLGVADGLATYLRRKLSPADYIGIELEINQAILTKPGAPTSFGTVLAKFFQGTQSELVQQK